MFHIGVQVYQTWWKRSFLRCFTIWGPFWDTKWESKHNITHLLVINDWIKAIYIHINWLFIVLILYVGYLLLWKPKMIWSSPYWFWLKYKHKVVESACVQHQWLKQVCAVHFFGCTRITVGTMQIFRLWNTFHSLNKGASSSRFIFSKSNRYISLHFGHWLLRKIDLIYFCLRCMQNEWGTGWLNLSFHSKWCPTSSVRTMKSQFIKIDIALIQSLIISRCSVFCFDIHFVSQNWPHLTKHLKNDLFHHIWYTYTPLWNIKTN